MGKVGKFFAGIGVLTVVAAGGCMGVVGGAASEAVDAVEKGSTGKTEGKGGKAAAKYLKDCVSKSGTPAQKEAVAHVKQVHGADRQNNIIDVAEVMTNYKLDLMSGSDEAKLISSSFATCYDSSNGLVTVYAADGEMMGNGNF